LSPGKVKLFSKFIVKPKVLHKL